MAIEKLDSEYNRGYREAIQDVTKEFSYVLDDLKIHNKRINARMCIRLLQLFLQHRENYREQFGGFIRFNTQLQDLEFFMPER